ncbi:hypothetical protein [uncultured Chryseobacterium sp.]|uniref:hypothetical protein n=1 Tax=uncultured Chryseobacterium sp. TaxID=259322 RepID=UPI00258DE661|nr:hypothetical protein [uncultured Chryseobacterium sp.]
MKKILFASALALCALSCKENKPRQAPVVENAVDNAASSVSNSIKKNTRYSDGGNLVHEIYHELIKNDKALQDLEVRIENTFKETEDVLSEYMNVIDKSETYYNDAKALTNSLTDSAAKKEIENALKLSSEKYHLKTQTTRDLIKKIKANKIALYEQQMVFKIKKTLPEIEKYQNAHPLKTDQLNQCIKKQNDLLAELKKIQ